MKQIGVRYLWSTLNLLHIAVVLVTVVYYCFRAKFSRPILRCNSKSSINWFWCCPVFCCPPDSTRPLQIFTIFIKLGVEVCKIYFTHLNHINHQLNRNHIPNEMTVLKCDGSCCWLLLPMKNYIQLPISYYYVRYSMYKHQSDIFVQLKELIRHFGPLQTLCMTNHQWAISTEHENPISWELCHS